MGSHPKPIPPVPATQNHFRMILSPIPSIPDFKYLALSQFMSVVLLTIKIFPIAFLKGSFRDQKSEYKQHFEHISNAFSSHSDLLPWSDLMPARAGTGTR
jgi:hypothetical protein